MCLDRHCHAATELLQLLKGSGCRNEKPFPSLHGCGDPGRHAAEAAADDKDGRVLLVMGQQSVPKPSRSAHTLDAKLIPGQPALALSGIEARCRSSLRHISPIHRRKPTRRSFLAEA